MSVKAFDGVFEMPVPGRTAKPRQEGLTMIIDKGLGLGATQDLLDSAADAIDFIKLTFGTSAFLDIDYLAEKVEMVKDYDIYICPGGKPLSTTGTLVNDGATILYRASKHDCQSCVLKNRCCPNTPARKVPRSIYEGARDLARQIATSWRGCVSRRLRKKVEMLFAHLKRILKLDRLRLRGPNGARDEFILAATAQNLRKMAKLIPMPTPRPA